jgi:hypothetical protein
VEIKIVEPHVIERLGRLVRLGFVEQPDAREARPEELEVFDLVGRRVADGDAHMEVLPGREGVVAEEAIFAPRPCVIAAPVPRERRVARL